MMVHIDVLLAVALFVFAVSFPAGLYVSPRRNTRRPSMSRDRPTGAQREGRYHP